MHTSSSYMISASAKVNCPVFWVKCFCCIEWEVYFVNALIAVISMYLAGDEGSWQLLHVFLVLAVLITNGK